MKKSLLLCNIACAAAMLISAPLSGCSSGTAKSPSASYAASSVSVATWNTSATDTVVISVIDGYYTDGIRQMAKNYMKLHPETNVVVDVSANEKTYSAKLKNSLSADVESAADIADISYVNDKSRYAMDLSSFINESNDYNDGNTVGSVYDDNVVNYLEINNGGSLLFLPFDYRSVGFYYNKTIFDKYGLSVPKTFEGLLSSCKTLKNAGYGSAIAASSDATWIGGIIADLAYRSKTADFLTLPGNALYDAVTMSQNKSIVYSERNTNFDLCAVMNMEKIYKYLKSSGFDTNENRFVWTKFALLSGYFQKGWLYSETNTVVNSFESQSSPIMLAGSEEINVLKNDLSKLPSSRQFEWGTFSLPDFTDNEGYTGSLRCLREYSSEMGIIKKSDSDHETRVMDVLKYWYSPSAAQMIYDKAISGGNIVQGPPALNCVSISEKNKQHIDGFVSDGMINQIWSKFISAYTVSDKSKYNSLLISLSSGTISTDKFLAQIDTIGKSAVASQISENGWDLDPKTSDN